MAKAGSTRINIKATSSLPDGSTPNSNTDTKDSSNQNADKKKTANDSNTAIAAESNENNKAFSDHVGEEDDGVSETSDIDVVAAADLKRKEKAKSEEGKDSGAPKILKKAASEERKGSAERSASNKRAKSQYPSKLKQNELITRQEMAL